MFEVNFDSLVGPTHNYSGLSFGNTASTAHKNASSNPKAAALEGLEKMYDLFGMGIMQAVLPPHERPYIPMLRQLGFGGTDAEALHACYRSMPELIPQITSSSFMWAANAATVCPSADSIDKKVHFTPANLVTKLHRSIEKRFTFELFNRIFPDRQLFTIHSPLPHYRQFADEGAANHTRFCPTNDGPGVHLFVYGFSSLRPLALQPSHFPPRQSLEACRALARRHQLPQQTVVYAQQHPRAIDAGVFHNDVASVGNGTFFLCHEDAFIATDVVIDELKNKVEEVCSAPLHPYIIHNHELTLDEAVKTYLFNSQILTLPNQTMAIIAPAQCRDYAKTKDIIDRMIEDNDSPVAKVHYVDLSQSMQNGGGPACLRLRVTLTENELNRCHPGIIFNHRLYGELKRWITNNYRDTLSPEELADETLLKESQSALDELTQILELGPIYSFQK